MNIYNWRYTVALIDIDCPNCGFAFGGALGGGGGGIRPPFATMEKGPTSNLQSAKRTRNFFPETEDK
jgi:hypothetical protein